MIKKKKKSKSPQIALKFPFLVRILLFLMCLWWWSNSVGEQSGCLSTLHNVGGLQGKEWEVYKCNGHQKLLVQPITPGSLHCLHLILFPDVFKFPKTHPYFVYPYISSWTQCIFIIYWQSHLIYLHPPEKAIKIHKSGYSNNLLFIVV